MQCPYCGHSPIFRHGTASRRKPLYFCPACQQVFAPAHYKPKSFYTRLTRWQRRALWLGCSLLLLFLLAVTPVGMALLGWGLTAFLPADSGVPVDAIVILGRGPALRDNRIGVAAELWYSQRSPKIFASGMNDAREIVESLGRLGVPRKAMQGETCSGSTEENALFTGTLLYPQHVRKILLVTDKPHMLRSILVFRSVGFEVVPHAAAVPDTLEPVAKDELILREYGGLFSYQWLGKLKPRSIDEFAHPPTEISERIVNWTCKV